MHACAGLRARNCAVVKLKLELETLRCIWVKRTLGRGRTQCDEFTVPYAAFITLEAENFFQLEGVV